MKSGNKNQDLRGRKMSPPSQSSSAAPLEEQRKMSKSTSKSTKDETAISTKQTTCITFDYNNHTNGNSRFYSTSNAGKSNLKYHQSKQGIGTDPQQQQLDFIGPATAVKDLFALPFSNDVNVAVAVHNLGNGTLMIDGAVVGEVGDATTESEAEAEAVNAREKQQTHRHRRRRRRRPRPFSHDEDPTQKLPPTPTKQGMEMGMNSYSNSNPGQEQDNLKDFVSNMLELQQKYLESSSTHTTEVPCIQNSLNNDDGHGKERTQLKYDEEDRTRTAVDTRGNVSDAMVAKSPSVIKVFENKNQSLLLDHIIPKPDTYTTTCTGDEDAMNDESRTYHQWQFGRYNMLVGSDAIILNNEHVSNTSNDTGRADESYSNTNCHDDMRKERYGSSGRQQTESTSTCTTLSVRIADVDQLRSKLDQREQDILSARQSYAEALSSLNENNRDGFHGNEHDQDKDGDEVIGEQSNLITTEQCTSNDIVAKRNEYPDFSRMAIQSCVLPYSDFQWQMQKYGFTAKKVAVIDPPIHATGTGTGTGGGETNAGGAPSSSPVCMVLDAYLDNIIANVPQLALCLQKKGLIQAVKLFDTEDLPTLSSDSLESVNANDPTTTHTRTMGSQTRSGFSPVEPLFSPQIVESNASMLLEFLKANCDKENSTYLLQRNAGETSVRLLDVSTLSRQRHRKWIYWLAMMSLRFALRLDRISDRTEGVGMHVVNEEVKREYRRKKRGLLENALELLHELTDMDGGRFETICAGIFEQLADLFLDQNDSTDGESKRNKGSAFDSFSCSFLKSGSGDVDSSFSTQLFDNVTCDSLSRAQDLLMKGIKKLEPALASAFHNQQLDVGDDELETSLEVEAIFLQMYGIYHKLTNVTLSLAEKSLLLYKSSSVMQALRLASRVIADSATLLVKVGITKASGGEGDSLLMGHHKNDFVCSLAYQFSHLYKSCGDLTRSFAADEAMRERGHACGDDLISLLQDVELSSTVTTRIVKVATIPTVSSQSHIHSITSKTKGVLTLNYLSGILPLSDEGDLLDSRTDSRVEKANTLLRRQKQLKKDKRRVLVAAVICYSQATEIFDLNVESFVERSPEITSTLELMLQRFGDACNEVGKVLLDELRGILQTRSFSLPIATSLLLSAEYWFKEGLTNFQLCNDATNVAFLRCNLCQCCKMRSNVTDLSLPRMVFVGRQDDGEKNRDIDNIKDASRHLELAHEVLCQRENNPSAWDMVSSELAATYLILGVKRRNILIGREPPTLTLRLSPGDERSIIEPLERAKSIFESLGDQRQSATSQYHLALYYSKVWTCQRDEARTKEKLSLCFREFGSAHKYFFSNMRFNEDTFVCLILDLSNLYATVSSGYECQEKALLCCLDTSDVFSFSCIRAKGERKPGSTKDSSFEEWFQKMTDLNEKMEKRILSLLSTLVRLEKQIPLPSKYESVYREILRLKVSCNSGSSNTSSEKLSSFTYLQMVKKTI